MADLFDDRLGEEVLALEGGSRFTNDPNDAGGATRWGVTAAKLGEWRKLGRPATPDEVAALGHDEALAIYKQEFWVDPGFINMAGPSPRIAELLFEAGVNMGVVLPGQYLQRILNALNNGATLWPDVPVTGRVGPLTMQAYAALVARRGAADAEGCVLTGVRSFMFVRYVELCEAGTGRAANEEYEWGWLKNRVGW